MTILYYDVHVTNNDIVKDILVNGKYNTTEYRYLDHNIRIIINNRHDIEEVDNILTLRLYTDNFETHLCCRLSYLHDVLYLLKDSDYIMMYNSLTRSILLITRFNEETVIAKIRTIN